MLAKKTVEKRRVRELKVRPQVRKTFPPEGELRALARSVMKRQLHPFIILPQDIILDGECRWRGLMLENPDFEVDVIVVDRELTPAEVCELQMISAMHSTSLSAYDQALACKEWMGQTPNATAKELAEKIDRDPSMVGKLLSLWKTIPAAIRAAEEGKIGPKAWHQLSLLSESEQAGFLEMLTSGMPVAQVAEISRKQRNARTKPDKPEGKLAKGKFPLPKAMVQITGDGLTLAAMIDVLTDLLKEAKAGHAQGMDIRALMALLVARTKDKAKKV